MRHQERQDQLEMKSELKAQFQCRYLQEGRRPWIHDYLWIFRRILWQTTKTADIGTAIRQIPYTVLISMLEDKIQNSSDYLFWFSIRSFAMDQRSGDDRVIGWIEILPINCWPGFPEFWNAGREDCFCFEKASHECALPENSKCRRAACSERRPILATEAVLDYADLFSVTFRDDNIQEFDTRWDEVLLSLSKKKPSDDILETLYKLRICESDQLKTVLEM